MLPFHSKIIDTFVTPKIRQWFCIWQLSSEIVNSKAYNTRTQLFLWSQYTYMNCWVVWSPHLPQTYLLPPVIGSNAGLARFVKYISRR